MNSAIFSSVHSPGFSMEQHIPTTVNFQTKARCWTGAWAVSDALSLYSSKIVESKRPVSHGRILIEVDYQYVRSHPDL